MSAFAHPTAGSSQVDLLDLGFDEVPEIAGGEGDALRSYEQRRPAEPKAGQPSMTTIAFNAAEEERQSEQQAGASHGRNFLDKLTDPSASAREYQVVFGLAASANGRPDLGLTMESDYEGKQAVVKGFSLVDGKIGPAQACGLICVGDILVCVNDDRVKGMSFYEALAVVRQACRERGQIRLTFTAGTGEELRPRPEDRRKSSRRSISRSEEFQPFQRSKAPEMREARWFIHQQKARYYRPPPPDEDMVYCSLERHRGENVTSFHLHRDDTGEFLLACSVSADLLGPMLLHTLQDTHLRDLKDIPTDSDSAVYLGCTIPNFIGTEFRILDHRINPRSPEIMDFVSDKGKNELGAVVFDMNVMGRVPNSMKALLRTPKVTQDTGAIGVHGAEGEGQAQGQGRGDGEWQGFVERGVWDEPIIKRWEDVKNKNRPGFRPSSPLRSIGGMFRGAFSGGTQSSSDGMREGYATVSSEGSDVNVFETMKPSWNEQLNAWTLNFNGRVKIASKKNFLIAPEKGNLRVEQDFGEGRVHLRHGKMSKSRFSVDFRNPMSPMVALAVCCSTFAKKLTVT